MIEEVWTGTVCAVLHKITKILLKRWLEREEGWAKQRGRCHGAAGSDDDKQSFRPPRQCF